MFGRLPTLLRSSTSIAIACAAVSTGTAHAQVVFSTYGPSDSYASSWMSAGFAGYGLNAARFVPTTTGDVNQVETSIARGAGGTLTDSYTVRIVPEIFGGPGGQPGILPVWSATAVTPAVDQRAIYTFTGPRGTLLAGQAYWLVLEATYNTNWYYSSPPVSGTTGTRNGGSFWSTIPGGQMPAMRISYVGAAATGSCCNAATGGCTVVTAAACGAVNLRYGGDFTSCSAALCRSCPGDFNRSGALEVQDIFDFLNAWLAGCP